MGVLTDIKKEKGWKSYASAGHVSTQNDVPKYIQYNKHNDSQNSQTILFADI